MKQEFNFDKIGKKLPYSVPENFFDLNAKQIIEENAKRERISKNRKLIISTLAVASSIALIVSIYLFVNMEDKSIVVTAESSNKTKIEISKNSQVLTVKNSLEDNSIKQKVRCRDEMKTDILKKNNSVDELLASLSDEELEQMMIGVENDPFLENPSY